MTTLYDHRGKPVDLKRLREAEAEPTLSGVRPVIAEHQAAGLTPAKLARILRGAVEGEPEAYLSLAEDMEDRFFHYRSVLATRKNQVASLPVTVVAAGDDAASQAHADFIRDMLARPTLSTEIFDVLDALGKGYSATEILWDTSEGQWMPMSLEWRDPRWFALDRTDGKTLKLRTEQNPMGEPLEAYKWITHAHKSKSGLPIRGGLAVPATWAFLFWAFDSKAWARFVEVYGMPLRLGKYGPEATDQDKAKLLQAVRSISSDAAAILPASMEIAFEDTKASGSVAAFEKWATYLERQVSKLVLGQTGTTDVGQHVGTANAHERVREDIEAADAVQLSGTVNRDLVRPTVDLNFGPQKRYPQVKFERPDVEDVTALVDNVLKLVPFGLEVEASVIRDKLGLPDPPKGAILLTSPQAGRSEHRTRFQGRVARHAAEQGVDVLDALDQLGIDELGDWEPLVEPLIGPVEQLLASCSSLEEARDKLAQAIARQDPTALTDILARGMFSARLAGELGVDLADVQPKGRR